MTRIIDLSHPLVHGQPVLPGDPPLVLRLQSTIASVGFNVTQIQFGSHQGTHCDVPFHFFNNGKAVDQMPLDRFYGPATVLDLAPNGSLPPQTLISVAMLEAYREKFQPGAKVLIRTGWDRSFGTSEYFADFPSLTQDAADWIAERQIGLLGMDTPGPSTDYQPVHQRLLRREVEMVLVENLTNLGKLPEHFLFAAFPLAFQGGDGSPVRAVGIVQD